MNEEQTKTDLDEWLPEPGPDMPRHVAETHTAASTGMGPSDPTADPEPASTGPSEPAPARTGRGRHSAPSRRAAAVDRPKRGGILAPIALILAIIAVLVAAFTPHHGLAAIPVGIIALILSLIALTLAGRRRRRGLIASLLGLILSILSAGIPFLIRSVTWDMVDSLPAIIATFTSDDGPLSLKATPTEDPQGSVRGSDLTVESVKSGFRTGDGHPVAVATFTWRNDTGSEATFNGALTANMFQNGRSLEQTEPADSAGGYRAGSGDEPVAAGQTATVTIAYLLDAAGGQVVIELSDPLDADAGSISQTFSL